MPSNLFRLSQSDFIKGAISAVFGAVFMTVYSVVNQSGFDLFTVDWNAVLQMTINGALAAFMGYLSKQFFSDSEGNPLGYKI